MLAIIEVILMLFGAMSLFSAYLIEKVMNGFFDHSYCGGLN